jgi:chromosome segregation ATPase
MMDTTSATEIDELAAALESAQHLLIDLMKEKPETAGAVDTERAEAAKLRARRKTEIADAVSMDKLRETDDEIAAADLRIELAQGRLDAVTDRAARAERRVREAEVSLRDARQRVGPLRKSLSENLRFVQELRSNAARLRSAAAAADDAVRQRETIIDETRAELSRLAGPAGLTDLPAPRVRIARAPRPLRYS